MGELIKYLSEQIEDFLFEEGNDLSQFKEDLNRIEPIEFIKYEFSQPHGNTYPWEFMLAYFEYWRNNLSYQDCLNILGHLKNNKLGLYSYLPFCYKYLNIDLISTFFELDGIDEEVQYYVKNHIEQQWNTFLIESFDMRLLKRSKISLKMLQQITESLIAQGAIPVQNQLKYDL